MKNDIIDFMEYVIKLKKTKRTGWIDVGIKDCESVAEHSYATAILAMMLARRFKLDENRMIKMALIHDLAESVIGDINFKDIHDGKISIKEKFEKEKKAMKDIISNLEDGEEIYNLWLEFEEQKTPEAKILKQLDKIELLLQANEYEKEHGKEKIDVFWNYLPQYKIENEYLKSLIEELKKRRKK